MPCRHALRFVICLAIACFLKMDVTAQTTESDDETSIQTITAYPTNRRTATGPKTSRTEVSFSSSTNPPTQTNTNSSTLSTSNTDTYNDSSSSTSGISFSTTGKPIEEVDASFDFVLLAIIVMVSILVFAAFAVLAVAVTRKRSERKNDDFTMQLNVADLIA